MAVILNFPLQKFFHNVFETIKKNQDEILRRKTEFLYREAYRYFLDLYLMNVRKYRLVDFPDFMYLSGMIICREAQSNAERAMLDVIKSKAVNKCYTKKIKELKKVGY